MQGKKTFTPKMMYAISLEDLVPEDDYYRRINELLDLRFVYRLSKEKYGKTGNPSIDPVVFFKIQLYGYFENITSDRKLVRKISDSLSARLFIGYDFDEEIPWHSTISRTRQHLGESIFEEVFNYILELCIDAGLVEGKHQSVDSTLVRSNSSFNSLERKRPIYNITEYAERIKQENTEEYPGLSKASVRKEDKKSKDNSNSRSKTDPDSRIAKKGGKPANMYYLTHCTVDAKKRVITDILTTYADRKDSRDLLECVERSKERLTKNGLMVEAISADKGYFSGENLRKLEMQGITPYIPQQRYSNKKGGISKEEFIYDKERDCYICPAKKELHLKSVSKDGRKNYLGEISDCTECLIKKLCTKAKQRKITRSQYSDEYERNEIRLSLPEGKIAMKKRMANSESIFSESKMNHGLSRFNMRRLTNVRKASYLIASVLNIKRLLSEKGKSYKTTISKSINDHLDTFIESYCYKNTIPVILCTW